MRIPILSPVKDFFASVAWDAAVNTVELFSLGARGWWWRLHWAAMRHFFLDPPARVVMRESPALGLPSGQCVYGETPVLTYVTLMRLAGITRDDMVIDLGCGRGLGLMGAALFYGVRARGIEIVPTLLERARKVAHDVGLEGQVTWTCGDILEEDLSEGSIFYVASTTFDRRIMSLLSDRLAEVGRQRAREGRSPLTVFTLTRELHPPFAVTWSHRYPMTWGWATVYCHHLEECPPRGRVAAAHAPAGTLAPPQEPSPPAGALAPPREPSPPRRSPRPPAGVPPPAGAPPPREGLPPRETPPLRENPAPKKTTRPIVVIRRVALVAEERESSSRPWTALVASQLPRPCRARPGLPSQRPGGRWARGRASRRRS